MHAVVPTSLMQQKCEHMPPSLCAQGTCNALVGPYPERDIEPLNIEDLQDPEQVGIQEYFCCLAHRQKDTSSQERM